MRPQPSAILISVFPLKAVSTPLGRYHANYLGLPNISLSKIVANLNLGLERFASAECVRVPVHAAESSGHSNKICQRYCLHFSHQIGAMNFNGCFAGLNLAGDLLVAPARHDQSHYRTLPRSQRVAAP